MKLSIIINHYQTPEILKLCLEGVIKNTQNISREIIVTDSETIDKTVVMMREEFPQIIFIPAQKNLGFGKIVNIGIKKARGDYFLLINADIIIEEAGTIEKMISYMESYPEIGLLGPKLLNINNTLQSSFFRFYTPMVILCRRTPLGKTSWGKKVLDRFLMKDILVNGELRDNKPKPVDWLMGSALLTKKEAVAKVGLFDERFFMYFEDVDWCRRFWENSYKVVYFPEVQMYHYHFQASKRGRTIFDFIMNKYTRIHLTSAVKYFLKYGLKVPHYGI